MKRASTSASARRWVLRGVASTVVLLLGCAGPNANAAVNDELAEPEVAPETEIATETEAQLLPLAGEILREDSEVSGLAWLGDRLILLPQFPRRFGGDAGIGVLFSIDRQELETSIDRVSAAPLTPTPIPIELSGVPDLVPGFEGFEAIAVAGEHFAMTIEADVSGLTKAYVVLGVVVDDVFTLDPLSLREMENQTGLDNLGYEALTFFGDRLFAFHEYNGPGNPGRYAVSFGELGRASMQHFPMPQLSYRLTDATSADAHGRFWVTNYFWEDEEWDPGVCLLTERFGQGASHRQTHCVERLVELEISDEGVHLRDQPPLLLFLQEGRGRNWEGVARLGDRGLLMVTDEHPATLLAFVPFLSADSPP